ncbi:acyl-CoA dehydrogenase C-terminal domain-containing protein [Ruegeria halocynthiae]|uniref:acyl-CoA dehydrogenase C-terminal domain-containing protein n=1 Tax=Ruegeria halocynthiae TaxID=985054 RepID=UPI00055A7AA3|nr:acyl-CoA dehydrogenase C-terminal domain-containing protein [Ruegeria halocynthiae]
MTEYRAPIRDMRFAFEEVLGSVSHYDAVYPEAGVDSDTIAAIMEERAKFCENELVPLYRSGDEQGCTITDGVVTAPDGFRAAYEAYCEAGWPSIAGHEEFGGQGLPPSLGSMLQEMNVSANHAFSMYATLSEGARETIEAHGTDAQKALYLPKLVDGTWTGTMCLTEPQCGTDLNLVRCRAEPNDDGSYALHGTKIFISAGDHDMADNIVHIVLARLPDAPAGTKGISLFIVPRHHVNADGSVEEARNVQTGSIEHKMGICGNATCVLNFDGSKGYLIGEPHKGLRAMFTFMNSARMGVALEGVAHGELGLQKSRAYALERLSGRAATGPVNPDGPADPIIVHPDVRRMLLTQMALTEGSRMLSYFCNKQVDLTLHAQDADSRAEANDLLAYLTPVAKAFATESAFESANLAVQVFGGHGFIREWGVEQNVRDVRITMLYEGTTGIQALDLLGRKVLRPGGEALGGFRDMVQSFCDEQAGNAAMAEFITPLRGLHDRIDGLAQDIAEKAQANPNEVAAAAVDYLMASGYYTLAYFWARAAKTAQDALAAGTSEQDFYNTKLAVARFYMQRLLPRADTHISVLGVGCESLMGLPDDAFAV